MKLTLVQVGYQRLAAGRQLEQALAQPGHGGNVDLPGDRHGRIALPAPDPDGQCLAHNPASCPRYCLPGRGARNHHLPRSLPATFSKPDGLTRFLAPLLPAPPVAWALTGVRHPGDGVGGARPGGEPFPQAGYVVWGHTVQQGEPVVGEAVEPLAGVCEVLAGQAGVQVQGQGGELGDGVAAGEGGGDIDVVALGGPGRQRGDLAADRIIQVSTGPISIRTGWRPRSK